MTDDRLSPTDRVQRYLHQSTTVKERTAEEGAEAIAAAADLAAETLRNGGKLMLCGNGGSAADAQHLAAEFTNRFREEINRPPLPALALTTDTSFLTACSNDFEFESVFEKQVRALGKPHDSLIGISTSGRSENVVRALGTASELGLSTIALTGGDGGQVAGLADVSVLVPDTRTPFIQEAHISIGHVLVELVERSMFDR